MSLEPDAAIIERFAGVVFGGHDGFVPVRLVGEKGTADRSANSKCLAANATLPSQLYAEAKRAAREQRALYAVPGTMTARGRGRKTDIERMSVVLVDIDEGDIEAKRAHLVAHLGPPSLEVASGGTTSEGAAKLHLYWRLSKVASGSDVDRVCELRGLLARKAGCDMSFEGAQQPVRVAGSVHGKFGIERLVTIIAERDLTRDLVGLEAIATEMPALAGCDPVLPFPIAIEPRDPGRAVRQLQVHPVREQGLDGITRFTALSKTMGHWIRQARIGTADEEEAWQAVIDYNAAMVRPPWDEQRLRREFETLTAVDRGKSGAGATSPSAITHVTEGSEDGLAARFTDLHGPDWKHVVSLGKWFEWTGTVWKQDDIGRINELVRQVCRTAASAARTPGDARRIATDRTVRAVERLLRTDPRHALRESDLDADPMLLNTPDGLVDLFTGEIRGHDRASLMTMTTGAGLGSACPRWIEFLEEVSGGDADLIAYLRRVAGYCLTGVTSEQVFFFLHGPGANGKSVFLSVLTAVMGDYAATASDASFMAGRDQHSTDLAGLRGARLVGVAETEAGRAWAESRIKTITGGDTLRVRLMYKDFFELHPTFKLLIVGNHRPRLKGVGEAMRRRIHMISFGLTIPPERRDRGLLAALLGEKDGILGWMLAGCADWRAQGLRPPASVLAAASEYFADEDIFAQWMSEVCAQGPELRTPSRVLYLNWATWAREAGHDPGSEREFSEQLNERGFTKQRSARSRFWIGLALRHAALAADAEGEAS